MFPRSITQSPHVCIPNMPQHLHALALFHHKPYDYCLEFSAESRNANWMMTVQNSSQLEAIWKQLLFVHTPLPKYISTKPERDFPHLWWCWWKCPDSHLSWKPSLKPPCCFPFSCFSMTAFSASCVSAHPCWKLSRNTVFSSQLLPSFPESSPSVSCSLRSPVLPRLCSFHRCASHLPAISTSFGRLMSKLLGAAQLCGRPRTHMKSENVWGSAGKRAENRMPIGNLAEHILLTKAFFFFFNPCLSHCTNTAVLCSRLFVKVLVSGSVIRLHTRVHNTTKLGEHKRCNTDGGFSLQ